MEIGELQAIEAEKMQLEKRVVFGYERSNYVDSERQALRLEGHLFVNGYTRENLELEANNNPLDRLHNRLVGALAAFNARNAGWKEEDILQTVDAGKQYARDAHRYKQLTGRSPNQAYAKAKIFMPMVRSGRIKV